MQFFHDQIKPGCDVSHRVLEVNHLSGQSSQWKKGHIVFIKLLFINLGYFDKTIWNILELACEKNYTFLQMTVDCDYVNKVRN